MYTLTLILFVFIVVSPCLTKIDFQIQCFSLTFHVMIFILCERSRYFYAANNIKSNPNKISKTRLKSWKPKFFYCPHVCSDKWTAFWFQGSLMRGVVLWLQRWNQVADYIHNSRLLKFHKIMMKDFMTIVLMQERFCISMRFNWSDIVISTSTMR